MPIEVEIIGLSYRCGKDDTGKSYSYYVAHIAYPNKYVDGMAVAVTNMRDEYAAAHMVAPGCRLPAVVMYVDKKPRFCFI